MMSQEETFRNELLHALFQDLQYAEQLLSKNDDWANLDSIDENSNSILHMLAYHDMAPAAKLLLKYGANVNMRNRNGEGPIHWATRRKSFRTLLVLIEFNVDVNIQDISGSTPSHLCAVLDLPEIVPLLASSGILRSDIVDNDGNTALVSAEITGHDAVSSILKRSLAIMNKLSVSANSNKEKSLKVPYLSQQQTISSASLLNSSLRDPSLSLSKKLSSTSLSILSTPNPHTSRTKAPFKKKPYIFWSSEPRSDPFTTATSEGLLNLHEPISPDPLKPLIQCQSIWEKISSSPEWPLHSANPSYKPTFSNISQSLVRSTIASKVASSSAVEQLLNLTPRFFPFLPRLSTSYDLVLVVEQCVSCHLHTMSLSHNEKKYTKIADNILESISTFILECKFPVRLFAYKVKAKKSEYRYGSLLYTHPILN